MYRPWSKFRHASFQLPHRRYIADARPFEPGDLVMLRPVKDPRKAAPILTRPLKPGRRIDSHRGLLQHDAILGKRVRDVVCTETSRSGKAGAEYRVHEVRLEDFVRLSRRLVTPIYPSDASLIVDLLDLHPDFSTIDPSERLEILEAGTGHGALTLYLSRAIHAANPTVALRAPSPDAEQEALVSYRSALEDYKSSRRAVIHTIERSEKYSKHAQSQVQTFRHGLYHRNVDFHVGDVGAWTQHALAERNGTPFLSHAFLDLPGQEEHLEVVARALRTDASVVVFCPSITQVIACAEHARDGKLGLELEKVVELGVNGGSGGREWDLRTVRIRAEDNLTASKDVSSETNRSEPDADDASEVSVGDDGVSESDDASDNETSTSVPDTTSETASNGRLATICRPKVGERVIGGGFLGLWRKRGDSSVPT